MQEARRTPKSPHSPQAMDSLSASIGLGSTPFSMAINQMSYYETASAKRIMELIVDGVEARKGFFMLSGEAGVGKSSLLLRLLSRLKSRGMVTSLVVNSLVDKKELLENVCADFGLKHRPGLNASHLLIVLHTFFLHQFKKGRNCVILADEAHHLGYEALESLRMLANLETGGVKLVQVVICGRPELHARLQSRRLRPVANRISTVVDLPALTRIETSGYVEFKLALSGLRIRPSTKTLELLWNASLGNPRTVNLLMERCLHLMENQGLGDINSQIMLTAIQDLKNNTSGPSMPAAPAAGKHRNWSNFFGFKGMAGYAGPGMILMFIAIVFGWFIGQGGL
ncbi:ExeA family protein [Desulfonatronum parangueonense]